MTYVDGFVAAVPAANRGTYTEYAAKAARSFREQGALKVVECWGDDVPEGELTSFPMAVKRKEDEAVVFGWIVWPSKETRNAAWEKLMKDEDMQPDAMPFDGRRMIYGGFATIVDA